MNTSILKAGITTLLFFLFLFAFQGKVQAQADSSANLIEKTSAQIFVTDGKKKLFEGNIRGALIKFREAIQKDKGKASAYYWAGRCHFELNNYEYAIKYVEDALKIDTAADKEIYFLKGEILQKTNKLDEAIQAYKKSKIYISSNRIKELRIDHKIEECYRAKEMMDNPIPVEQNVMSTKINSRFPDYAPVIADSGRTMYFTSRRQNTKGAGLNPYDNLFYEDIYVSHYDGEDWSRAENDNEAVERLNTEGFDAVNAISADGTLLFVTINTSEMDKVKPETKSSDLCVARLSKKDRWNSPKQLSGNDINSNYFDASITITRDLSRAYFITERKDKNAQGSIDIWYSNSNSGRSFDTPKNLGSEINTEFEENTCYISPDGRYLFFSSKGHEGMGGYDIYVSENKGDYWTPPALLDYPINTTDDDLHFQWYPELKKAYYSTIPKENGKGDRDIVEIDLTNFDFEKYLEKITKEAEERALNEKDPVEEDDDAINPVQESKEAPPAVK